MDHKKLDKMVNQFMDDSVPYKHHIAPHNRGYAERSGRFGRRSS